MNSNSKDVIHSLKKDRVPLHVHKDAKWVGLDNDDSSDAYVQYVPMGEDGAVHFEILRTYQQLYVAFHDERPDSSGAKKKLCCRLGKIVARHKNILEVVNSREIRHKQYVDSRIDFKHIVEQLENTMREMYDLIIPALNGMENLENNGEDNFIVPDVALGRECMEKFLNESPLSVYGVVVKPLRDCENSDRSIYYSSPLKESVYEIRRCDVGIVVELHDRRKLIDPDNLVANLQHEASQYNFTFGGLFSADRFVRSSIIPCVRSFASIKNDVQILFEAMRAAFDPILERAQKEGPDSLPFYSMCIREMMPLSRPKEESGAIRLKDVGVDTFSWVTTIKSLFDKEVICLDDSHSTKIVTGNYVIPNYQRKYAWKAENVRALCRDLLRAQKNGTYHIGTVILHVEKTKNTFYVVDGQQRLRTISRLLSREFFSEYEEDSGRKIYSQFNVQDEKTIIAVLQEYEAEQQDVILKVLEQSTLVCIAVSNVTESFQLFSTQNGRGKELSPENLLKAYHFHAMGDCSLDEGVERWDDEGMREKKEHLDAIDERWERANVAMTERDGRLLSEVIGAHLFRIRSWARGLFPTTVFSSKFIDAFKGASIGSKTAGCAPLQNLAILRMFLGSHPEFEQEFEVIERSRKDEMQPFVTIDQSIVNGEDFFDYVDTYVKAYERLFSFNEHVGDGLDGFRAFYRDRCCEYSGSTRRGDQYARHVFQSLCLACYDRFGSAALEKCERDLFRCAYFERVTKSRCYYSTCGQHFTVQAVRAIFDSGDLLRLEEELHELGRMARKAYVENLPDEFPDGIDAMASALFEEREVVVHG